MANPSRGPTCTADLGDDWIDPGTNARTRNYSPAERHAAPATTGGGHDDLVLYSEAVKTTTDGTFTVAPNLTWDGYWRLYYDKIAEGIQEQANALLGRGQITRAEAAALVNGRNEVLLQVRSRLSPFGEMYSEILKPSGSLKTFETLLEQKGTIETVLSSVGKTRAVVDRIAIVSRVAGPAAIAFEVVLTVVVVERADPAARKRTAYQQGGRLVGSLSFGTAGMWAGCGTAAAFASPSLVVPIFGEISEGAACLVGGLIGGFGFGALGQKLGEQAGENVYHIVNDATPFTWTGD
jgi:hypothetical protein